MNAWMIALAVGIVLAAIAGIAWCCLAVASLMDKTQEDFEEPETTSGL